MSAPRTDRGETPSGEADGECRDAIVIGAGPAGALAARRLARLGARVALVERRRFPRTKVCGACLNRRAVEWLDVADLGSLLDRLGAIPVTKYRVASGGRAAELDLPGGAAVSRAAFDAALVDAAQAAGAEYLSESKAVVLPARGDEPHRAVRLESETLGATTLRARVVVVADGLGHPSLAECAEFPQEVATASRIGVSVIVDEPDAGPEFGVIAMHVGRDGYVGLVRLEDGRLNVAAAVDVRALRDAGGPRELVARVLASTNGPRLDLPASDAWRGTLPLTRRLLRPAGWRVLVAGDAAGYVEPFTGEGMAWALGGGWQAGALAWRAARVGWTQEIEQAWCDAYRRLIGPRFGWCRALATLVRHPRLANWALRAVGIWPALGRPIVGGLNRPLRRDEALAP